MLKQIDIGLSYLATGLGVVFLIITPMYTRSFFSRAGVEYMGAVLFLIFLGLLNIARIRSQHRSARTVAILANVMALLYLVLVVAVLQEPAAVGVSLPVLALCCTSWMNRANEGTKPPTTA